MPGVRRSAMVVFVALTALGVSAASPRAAQRHAAYARTVLVRILAPGAQPVTAVSLQGPPTAKGSLEGFSYPQDGSVATVASATGTAAVDVRHSAAAASARLASVSLFGGEITVDAISSNASASARAGIATGDSLGTAVESLLVLGQPIQATPNLRLSLGDWGEARLLESQGTPGVTLGVASFRQTTTAIAVTLLADHGGLPAGTRIEVGHAETFARLPLASRRPSPPASGQPEPSSPPPASGAGDTGSGGSGQTPPAASYPREFDRPSTGQSTPVYPSFAAAPRLTADRYVFPVYGPAGYGDTFGAPRADTVWHHGDDIFAPLGAPILAVTDGTVFSVGWQKVGGNRFWLRDHSGNEFYYAHLSTFSPLAANGASVKAGDVLGFVGNSGDAEGTPYHLHFEIHPATLLFLGYDGVVNPTPYLVAWRRLQDIHFPSGTAWAPVLAPRSDAPVPGAILIQSSDISSADGLDPVSLQRVLAPPSAEGAGVPSRG